MALDININVSKKFDSAVAGVINTMHSIMRVGTSVSKISLAINHKIVQYRWVIYPSIAKNTVELTMQSGVIILCPSPSLMKRILTNDRVIQYNRLPCNVFSDTLIYGTASKRGNKYAEDFATYFWWARDCPMKTKGNTHEDLSLLSQITGVPYHLFVGGYKEQVLVSFKKKLSVTVCCLKQMESYTLWKNTAEGTIKDLKHRSGRKITKSRIPKILCNQCLELEGTHLLSYNPCCI